MPGAMTQRPGRIGRHPAMAGGVLAIVLAAVLAATALGQRDGGSAPAAPNTPLTDGLPAAAGTARAGAGLDRFPDSGDTGVTVGTTLTRYGGPCTIDVPGTVIEAKQVDCVLSIRVGGVVIRNSVIRGGVDVDTEGASVSIERSDVVGGDRPGAAVGYRDITLTGSDVSGAQHGVNCSGNCRITDSYIHDQVVADQGDFHVQPFLSSGGSGILLRHNTLQCSAADTPVGGGCTANISIFGDFAGNTDFLIEDNLLLASASAGYCAYGGTDPDKPFGNEVSGIRFIDNVFQRGPAGTCGVFGAVTSFDPAAAGNVWRGNTFDDGDPLDID